MISLALSAALLAAAPGEGLRFDAQVVGEGRTRTLRVEGEHPQGNAALDVTPRLTLTLALSDFTADAWYGLRVLAPDLVKGCGVDLVHQGQLHAEKKLSGAWRLFSTAFGAYGRTDLITSASQDLTGAPQVATLVPIAFVGARANVGTAWSAGLRDALGCSAEWFATGGADAESRRSLPLQRGVRLGGSWDRALTPLATLATRVAATSATFDRGGSADLVQLSLTWRHRLTPTLDARAGAGAAAVRSRVPGWPEESRFLPTAELGFALAWAPLDTDLALRALPFLDALSGTYEERLEGKLRARWSLSPEWTLGADAGVTSAPWRAGGDAVTGRAEVRSDRILSRQTSFAAGLSAVWQRSGRPELLTFAQYGLFVAARFDTVPLEPAKR